MDIRTIATPTVALAVAVLLTMGVLAPVISDVSTDYESVDNEGSSWIRMVYQTSPVDFDVDFSVDNGTVEISDGAGSQSGSGDTILYADSNMSVWIQDGSVHLLGKNATSTISGTLSDGFSISGDSEGVTVSDGPDGGLGVYVFPVPAYQFIPAEGGRYGFFPNGTNVLNVPSDLPLATTGSYAGVDVYNDMNNFDIPLGEYQSGEEGYVDGVYWGEPLPDPEPEPTLVDDSPAEPSLAPTSSLNLDSVDTMGISDQFSSQLNGGLLGAAPPTANYYDGDWGYNLPSVSNPSYAIIVSYIGSGGGNITIPATVGGYNVREVGIGLRAIFDTSISATNLVISEGIENLNNKAFKDCSGFTGTLTLPSTLTSIGSETFNGCSGFTGTLTIPNTVSNISNQSFRGCSGFTGTLTLPSDLTYLGNYAFYGCSGFTGTLTIPNTLTNIYDHTFYGCSGLTSVSFSNSITQIDYNSFNGCTGITGTVTLPSSLITLNGAFVGCTGITGVILNNGLTTMTNSFNGCSGITGAIVIPDSVTSMKSGVFKGCANITSVTLSQNLTEIGSECFSGCTSLTSVSPLFPASLTSIANSAFSGCIAWSDSIVIPSSVTSIGTYAFYHCSSLTGITLNEGITTIPYRMCDGCSSMTGILSIPDSVTKIDAGAFYNCSGFTGLHLGQNISTIYYASSEHTYPVFGNCTGMTGTLEIPGSLKILPRFSINSPLNFTALIIHEGVEEIKPRAFENWTNLSGNLSLPNSLKIIGVNAFSQCQGFDGTLHIPDTVESVGKYAFSYCGFTGNLYVPIACAVSDDCFYNCSGFTSLTFANSITSLSEGLFYGCIGFTGSLNLPSNLVSIGRNTFTLCSGFTGDLIIPDSVTSIEQNAFNSWKGNGTLHLSPLITEIKSDTFSSSEFTTVTIPGNVEKIGSYAFQNSIISELILEEGVLEIGNSAFNSHGGFTKVNFPDSITKIGDSAFSIGYSSGHNTKLSGDLILPMSLKTLGSSAFGNSQTELTGVLVLPPNLESVGDSALGQHTSFTTIVAYCGSGTTWGASNYLRTVTNILDLSGDDWDTNRYGGVPAGAEVRTSIESIGYLGCTSYEETIQKDGALYVVLMTVPIVVLAGISFSVMAFLLNRKD